MPPVGPSSNSHSPFLHGTVHIEIVQGGLDSSISYDTLSYGWNVPRNIKFPDRGIIVETNGEWRELRLFKLLGGCFVVSCSFQVQSPISVDQICIKQLDNDEKRHQVQLMRNIYTGCTQVIT